MGRKLTQVGRVHQLGDAPGTPPSEACYRFSVNFGTEGCHKEDGRVLVPVALATPASYPHQMTLSGFPRISIDHAVCGGRPTVAGTRVRVSDVLEMLASGANEAEIVADYPYIAAADIRACLAYAAALADHPVVLAAE